ncbi:hypothetical protein D3C72_2014710 [compost metagenome]
MEAIRVGVFEHVAAVPIFSDPHAFAAVDLIIVVGRLGALCRQADQEPNCQNGAGDFLHRGEGHGRHVANARAGDARREDRIAITVLPQL